VLNALAKPQLAFPDKAWFQALAGFLEADDDFRKHAAFLTARIAFRVDQQLVTVAFDRGFVLEVVAGDQHFDYLISGTTAQWGFLFDAGWGLVRLYRSGTLTMRGDPVRMMQNWKAIFFITEGMKRFARTLSTAK
jgi:hypothetical protein